MMTGGRGDIKMWLALIGILFLVLLGLFSNVIAGEDGWIRFTPHEIPEEGTPYSPPGTNISSGTSGKSRTYVLGSDQLGRDVASRLVHGTRIALRVGLLSSLISLGIALLLGALAGYYGDKTQRVTVYQILVFVLGAILIHYYSYEGAFYEGTDGAWTWSFLSYSLTAIVGLGLVLLLCHMLRRWEANSVALKWDTLVIKLIEVFKSIPSLFLLLAVFAIIRRPSVTAVIVIIGLIRWPALTRIIRAEILQIKQSSYIQNAKLLGIPDIVVYMKHILPNIYPPILIVTALNIGTAILVESSLSFLHIGLPITEVSWGRMLSDARDYIPAWWLALGPGVMIFIAILSFNTISQRLSHHFESN